MATFKALVFEHHKREDGTYNVKIRVTHNRKTSYIKTSYYVSKKHLTKTFDIKDSFLNDQLNATIAGYRETIVKLGDKIQLYTAKELGEYLERKASGRSDNKIDFIEFANSYLERLRKKGRDRTAYNIETTVNSLMDFFGRKDIMITEITAKALEKFEDFLRSPRKIVRPGRNGTFVEYAKAPLSDVGVINYMTNVRTLFNAARDEFNDEDKDEIRISHYPFKKYKIASAPQTKKRNLKPEVIRMIRDMPDEVYHGTHGTNRAALARDVFMLSFYLVGMNSVDLFNIDNYEDGRLSYNRSKTKGRRQDEAFISIKVEPEARVLIDKYRDKSGVRVFSFHQMYSDSQAFNKNVNKGLKKVAELTKIQEPVTLYYARHSWATIARNVCRISMDDVSMALNHSSSEHSVTDIYIEKDWSIIDDANRKVLDLIYGS